MHSSEGCTARRIRRSGGCPALQGIVTTVEQERFSQAQEMELVDYSRPSAKPCETTASFCDTSLKDILLLVCSLEEGVFQTPFMDAQLPQDKNEEVELAILWFLGSECESPASAQLKVSCSVVYCWFGCCQGRRKRVV
ncbi:ran-binding protein 17 isoform X2 [Catharus ustulatus]|uniref:ran-binding protein 17 isoform X2 n=1 Tax=Catharus ustulatus TaxID=91951 RepID=UPI001C5B3FAE|nr:ran-binding protein 17 isoform X2 [Catharus ustulatus]